MVKSRTYASLNVSNTMKYRTQCTHCSTQFIIGQEQLNAYGGKVRCGKCSKVFDAMEHLQLNEDSGESIKKDDEDTGDYKVSFSSLLKDAQKDPQPTDIPRFTAKKDTPKPQTELEITSRKFNKIFSLLAVILIILMVIQSLYFIKPRITETARPLAKGLCVLVGCSLELPRDPARLRTEWSDLNYIPEYPNLAQLNIKLKNYSTQNVAFPFLQLSFKDDKDNILVRKIIPPQDYLSKEDQTKENFASNSNLNISLQLDFQKLKFSEYEIQWIYP